MSNIETTIVDTIINLRALVADLVWHLDMDNERQASRIMNDIFAYAKTYRWLPFTYYDIDRIDGFIKEECAPQGLDIARRWERSLAAIDIEDREFLDQAAW